MTASLLAVLCRGRRPSLEPLHTPEDDGYAAEELDSWAVGSRYEVLRALPLHARQDPYSDQCGKLKAGSVALVLALQEAQLAGEPVLMAYCANTTKSSRWTCGWAALAEEYGEPPSASASTASQTPPVGLRRLRGSWECGGRYRVADTLVLRVGVDLDSESIAELEKNEEVLVMELALVLRDGDPRLRASVRTDIGDFGWITIELPGGAPLLDSMNLFSMAAVRPVQFFRPSGRKSRMAAPRVSVSGKKIEEAWEVGGKYRMLTKAYLRKEAGLNSAVSACLKLGMLVTLMELRTVQWHPSVAGILRLKVSVDPNRANGPAVRTGWISAYGTSGEPLVDTRDHLEYLKVLSVFPLKDRTMSTTISTVSVQLRRGQDGLPLGLTFDHSDGRTLLIQEIAEDGHMAAWNATCAPHETVRPGDRIVCANGAVDNHELLLAQMGSDNLDLILQRDRGAEPSCRGPVASASPSSGPSQPPLSWGTADSAATEPLEPPTPAAQPTAEPVAHEGGGLSSNEPPSNEPTRPSIATKSTAEFGVKDGQGVLDAPSSDSSRGSSRSASSSSGGAGAAKDRPRGQRGSLSDPGLSRHRCLERARDEAGAVSLLRRREDDELSAGLEDELRLMDEHQASLGSAADLHWNLPAAAGGSVSQQGSPASREEREREWRPVGICVEEAPDSKLFGDVAGDGEDGEECRCHGPCKEAGSGLLASLFTCAPRADGRRSRGAVSAAASGLVGPGGDPTGAFPVLATTQPDSVVPGSVV